MNRVFISIIFLIGLLILVTYSQSQDRPVTFELIFSDERLNFIFDMGRIYQMGRSDGVKGAPMMRRSERERLKGVYELYSDSSISLEELHKAYEAGYLDGVKAIDTLDRRRRW